MATWIFQATPNDFDINGYLAASTGDFWFLVTRYKDQIALGDTVYIWRAIGRQGDRDKAGIIASAQVIGPVEVRDADVHSRRFWIDPAKATIPAARVPLRLTRLANQKEMLRREWMEKDSVLGSLGILKFRSGTNFPVTAQESVRISRLWANTGRDWSEADVIAALHIYAKLWDQPISKGKDSPVEQIAQLIGRAGTGVYNKLMNLRALDPRAPQDGLNGGSAVDSRVWERYFDSDAGMLNIAAIESDFHRLWESKGAVRLVEELPDPSVEAKRLSAKSLGDLLEAYSRTPRLPTRRAETTAWSYTRSPLVVAITVERANWKCEVNECTSPIFIGNDGNPIVEVHHLHRLADGGADDPSNTVCVCPNHHRALHHSKDAPALRNSLVILRERASRP